MKSLLLLFCVLILTNSGFSNPQSLSGADAVYDEIFQDRIYFKFRDGTAPVLMANLLSEFNIAYSEQAFSLSRSSLQSNEGQSLSSIQVGYLEKNSQPEVISRLLAQRPEILWAEPVVIPHTLHTPNDPQFSQNQSYLNFIKAPDAWAVSKGDTNIVIAIVDTGVDYLHPDLFPNVWINPNETENGQDDSGNGKIDDIHGWDFFSNDNNPIPSNNGHGTHVAGIAAAATNNNIGIASLGYNTRFMALKAGDGIGGGLPFAYQAVIYAAEEGADIINCSWGSTRFSRAAEEIVNFANSRGSIVVAAAGNDNSPDIFYPAGYASVISVGSVDLNGTKSSFSSYGPSVNVSAPGNQIYSTILNNEYGFSSGTSMAAPVVSALAALTKATHPDKSIEQIRAQIEGTTTPMNFSGSAANNWRYQTGTGYINASKALGDPVPYVAIVDYSFTDRAGNNNGSLEPGENIEINLSLVGYGIPDGGQIRATALDDFLIVDQRNTNFSSLTTGDTLHLRDIALRVSTQTALRSDLRSVLRLEFDFDSDQHYSRSAEVKLNPSQFTFNVNTISLTLGGAGQIGFLDGPGGDEGTGFELPSQASTADSRRSDILNRTLLFEGGLMFGNNLGSENAFVSNAVRSSPGSVDRDFLIREPFQIQRADDGSDIRSQVVFTDGNAGQNAYDITVTKTSWASNEAGHDQYILLNYDYHNSGNNTLSSFIGGLFLDFDALPNRKNSNYGFYVEEDDILVVAENNSGDEDVLLLGTTVMSGLATPFVIDNTGAQGFFGINDGFEMRSKAFSLRAGKVSTARNNTDISVVVAPKAMRLEPGENKDETFVLAWGLGYEELKNQIENARGKYQQVVSTPNEEVVDLPEQSAITSAYPNPFNPTTTLQVSVSEPGNYQLTALDILGRRVQLISDSFLDVGSHKIVFNSDNLPSGVYLISLSRNGVFINSKKVSLIK